ncbi:uncharacterized protein LOC131874449 [Cryptomeria japonica]|uniref:uncharacterized protein LOC131874449 n=1 Tax=Cryptomeria japonica TaxID=3369 RepID=UPI0027D9E44D|nr:uncharacterized protein LOC131874449 [Cryptomeria japonica]
MEYDISIKATKLDRGKGLCEQLARSIENSKEVEQQVETMLNNEKQPAAPALPVTWNQQIAHYLQIGDCLEGLDRSKRRHFRIQAIPYALIDEFELLEEKPMQIRLAQLVELEEIRREAYNKLEIHHAQIKRTFDRKVVPHLFNQGDLVFKWDELKNKCGRHTKFDATWDGLYVIT